jgi:hypothetical protein
MLYAQKAGEISAYSAEPAVLLVHWLSITVSHTLCDPWCSEGLK